MESRAAHHPPHAAYAARGGSPLLPPPSTRFTPGADFYNYVNYEWHRHVHLPPYKGSYGVSEEIETEVQNTLLGAIQRQRKDDPANPISKLATSFLNTTTQRNSIVDLQRLLNTFDCISNTDDVAHSIGALNRIQARAPLQLVVSGDSYKNGKCSIYLYEPMLGLPEKSYYAPGVRTHIFLKYVNMLKSVGKIMNIELLEQAVSIESIIAPYLNDNEAGQEYDYYPTTLNHLKLKYKNVPWETLMEGWGVAKDVYNKATFIITNKSYLQIFNRMFDTFYFEAWRTWMRAMTIISFIEYLPPPFDDMHFELFGKAIKGKAEKLPQKYLTLTVLQSFATQDLSRLFVKFAVAEGTKTRATNIVKQLKAATIRRLQALEWMGKDTKLSAVDKVNKMKFQVAYPERWESETAKVPIDVAHPLLNIINLMVLDSEQMIGDLKYNRCVRSEDKWEDGAFEVNAYYYSEANMMVVPAGILRAPFFDLKKSDAWNMGGIGASIGHEITHGFDADGRNYDSNGNYANWWSEDDSRAYNHMTKALIDLFDGVPYMGGKVNGKLTLSENLADLGGMAIALDALQHIMPAYLDEAAQKNVYTEFFVSYAVSWRNKDRPKKAKEALFIDVHAPPPLRVNLIVRQFEEFYKAFDIGPGDPGYIAPEERIRLW